MAGSSSTIASNSSVVSVSAREMSNAPSDTEYRNTREGQRLDGRCKRISGLQQELCQHRSILAIVHHVIDE